MLDLNFATKYTQRALKTLTSFINIIKNLKKVEIKMTCYLDYHLPSEKNWC